MAKERIGIMGGTFNPIHQGHIDMARAAAAQEKLDHVLFLPTGNPPHKREGVADAEDRFRMMAAAVAPEPLFVPSRLEIDRTGTTYTIDTLTLLKEKYPKAQLYYIIGADTLLELCHWREYQQVLQLCTFLVCPRRDSASPEALAAEQERLTALGGSFIWVDMPAVDVSSTEVRQTLARRWIPELLPPAVVAYIRAAGLYGIRTALPLGRQWLDQLWQALSLKRFAHSLCVAYTARYLACIHELDPVQAECAGLLHDCAKCLPLEEMQRICHAHALTQDASLLASGNLLHALVGAHLAGERYQDCAKCLPLEEMQRICHAHALTQDASLLASGNLLHALVGAHLAGERYQISDPDVLRAIACHTTGKVGMSPLDMVVYLADKIEPSRAPYPGLDQVRTEASHSLPCAMLLSLEGTARHVRKGGKPLHPATQAVMDWLRAQSQTQK